MRTRLASTLFLLATSGCSGLLGLDDFTEAETSSATTASGNPGSGGAGPTTTSTGIGAGGPGQGGQGGSGQGGSIPTEVVVSPAITKVGVFRAIQFQADAPVDWSVEEADGGTIDASGRYLSPAEPGVFHVVATLQADPSVTDTAQVTVAPLGLSVAGGVPAGPGNLDGPPARARFSNIEGLGALTNPRQLVIADTGNHTIRLYDEVDGMVTTLAGKSGEPGTQDGVGAAARFTNPRVLVANNNGGRVWVLDGAGDFGPTCIRFIEVATGAVTTLAGRCSLAGYVDSAQGEQVRFEGLNTMVLAPNGEGLYVCQVGQTARVFRHIDVATGATVTIDDGAYAVNNGCVMATDFFSDNIYFNSNTNDQMISRMTDAVPTPTITSVIGVPGSDSYVYGLAMDTGFGGSNDLYVLDLIDFGADGNGNFGLFRHRLGTGAIDLWMGGTYGYADGPVGEARFTSMSALTAHSPSGSMFFYDRDGRTVRRIGTQSGQQDVSTYLGTAAAFGPVDGNKTVARLNRPIGIALGDDGDLFVVSVSQEDNVVRRIADTGAIDVFSGVRGFDNGTVLTDGPADVAIFGPGYDIVRVGDALYVADGAGSAIRRVALADGEVTTIAGELGQPGFTDGFGAAAHFNFEDAGAGLATDGTALYVADAGNFAIRKVDLQTGEVTTLAGGNPGTANGNGLDAQFLAPVGLTFDAGVLYIVDSIDHVIRALDVDTDEVTTLIGLSGVQGELDGNASQATFRSPFRIAADGIGNLFVTEAPGEVHTIRRIALGSVEASHFAGDPEKVGFTPGPLPASLTCPLGLTVDGDGDLLVTDLCDDAVLAVRPL